MVESAAPSGGELVQRATGPEAQAEWQANLEKLFDAILRTPVGELFHPKQTADLVEGALSADALQNGARPASKLLWILLLGQLRDDKRRFADYVSDEQREALQELAARDDVVPERLIHEILEDEAAREVMADLVSHALREFQDKVNPFFAEWGLPALLKRLSPFGLGGMGKTFDSLRAEFEKRFDPEMRRFMTTFTGRGAKRVATYVVDHAGDKAFVALRKRIVRFLLDQTVAATLQSAGDPLLDRIYEIATDIAVYTTDLDSVRARRRLVVEQLVMLHASQPLGDALAQYGIVARPNFELLARVSWPFVRAALASPAGRAWLGSLTAPADR